MVNLIQYALLMIMLLNNSYLSYKYCNFYYGSKLLENFGCSDDCDSVMMSSYALLFGIPLPLYGLMYTLILSFLFIFFKERKISKYLIGFYLAVGLSFASYCLYLLYFVLKLNCKFCLLSHVSLILFSLSLLRKNNSK
ncbi:MAG: Vitamin epoxide reductase family [Cyanobacteriota bacterium]|jgi:uncharacterized membrane protein